MMLTVSTTQLKTLKNHNILQTQKPESKKEMKKYQTLTTLLKSFDTIVIIATTSTSITFSLTRVELIVIPISTTSTCAISIGKKVIYEIVMQKYNRYKKINKSLIFLINFIGKI